MLNAYVPSGRCHSRTFFNIPPGGRGDASEGNPDQGAVTWHGGL